jgi:hypothetical protein
MVRDELRVVFASTGDETYGARLTDAEGIPHGVEVTFSPFLTEDDYENIRWYLEEFMDLPDGGAVTRAMHVERWGRQLYDALFTAAENRALLTELLSAPEPRQLTIATRDPALLRLPWELMADDAGSLAARVSVRRQLERPETTGRPAAKLPLRILYVVSRPADAGFIDPIGHAVAEARTALLSTPARWIEPGPRGRTIQLRDWFLPHLYQRADDHALVPPDAVGLEPVRQFDVFLSHNHNDSARVESLARTLVETHGLRVWLDK